MLMKQPICASLLALSTMAAAWTTPAIITTRPTTLRLFASPASSSQSNNDNQNNDYAVASAIERLEQHSSPTVPQRRDFLNLLTTAASVVAVTATTPATPSAAAVVQAVGSGESACRQAGNCLQVGELDGAVGWNWGGKDRCDPADPTCGPDGRQRDGPPVGQAVPAAVNEITHVAAVQLDIGRSGETVVLKLGLYGNEQPGSVRQFLDFVSSQGLATDAANAAIGTITAPVSLQRGGVVSTIVPETTVTLGVPSQSIAYARSRNLPKAGDDFRPQPRPLPAWVAADQPGRSHSCAGLLSVPLTGLGRGGTGFEQVDEAYEDAFLVTARAVPALDQQRRVIGQVLDATSMAALERLATLPTKRGIRGVIPGQTSGPPLLKVVVRDTEVSKVAAPSSTASTTDAAV